VVNRWWLCVVCVVEGVKLRGFVGMGFRRGLWWLVECGFVVMVFRL
jgi:hypothetical protein